MPDPLQEHYGYLSDPVKIARYAAAINKVVRPDHVVMDLGCGSGLLGLMALRAGAHKVLFVEEGSIIEVARQTVTKAGFAARAEFLRCNSYEVALPDRVDVILCDHVGYFGFDYGVLDLLADARDRFLKPGGIIVPTEIELRTAPIESEEGRTLVARWHDGSIPDDFAWVAKPAANSKHALYAKPGDLLAEPTALATLELGATAEAFFNWTVDLRFSRGGRLDGLLGWFDCTLQDDTRMTNSPLADDKLSRPQAFLPLAEPVSVHADQFLRATIMARHSDHVLAWAIELPDQDRRFSMTTFNGLLLDDEALDRSRPNRPARLNDRGRARQTILSYCDGKRTVAEIEALVQRDHPQLFPSPRAAERMIRHVLAWDTSE
jgi:protein arginine N-methyltransferase 1